MFTTNLANFFHIGVYILLQYMFFIFTVFTNNFLSITQLKQ